MNAVKNCFALLMVLSVNSVYSQNTIENQIKKLPFEQGTIEYIVEDTVYTPQAATPGSYNPNLPLERIEEWKDAQKGVRNQTKSFTLNFNKDMLQYELQAEAGDIFIEDMHQILNINRKNKTATVVFLTPNLYKVETIQEDDDPEKQAISLFEAYIDYLSPEELLGTALIPKDLAKNYTFSKQENRPDGKDGYLISYTNTDDGYEMNTFHLNPYFKVDWGRYHLTPERIRTINYQHYEMKNGLDIPQTFTLEGYLFSSTQNLSEGQKYCTKKVIIKSVDQSPEFVAIENLKEL